MLYQKLPAYKTLCEIELINKVGKEKFDEIKRNYSYNNTDTTNSYTNNVANNTATNVVENKVENKVENETETSNVVSNTGS